MMLHLVGEPTLTMMPACRHDEHDDCPGVRLGHSDPVDIGPVRLPVMIDHPLTCACTCHDDD